LPADIASHQD